MMIDVVCRHDQIFRLKVSKLELKKKRDVAMEAIQVDNEINDLREKLELINRSNDAAIDTLKTLGMYGDMLCSQIESGETLIWAKSERASFENETLRKKKAEVKDALESALEQKMKLLEAHDRLQSALIENKQAPNNEFTPIRNNA